MKLFQSIRSRISFTTGFFLLFAVIASSIIYCVIFHNLLSDKFTDVAFAELSDVSNSIEFAMDQTQNTGATLSRMVKVEEAEGPLSPEKLQRCANVIAALPQVASCGIFLASDTLPPEGPARFEWYRQAKQLNLGVWNGQYVDTNMQAPPNETIIATYDCPIYNDHNQFIGIAVIQTSLEYISTIISSAKLSTNSFHQLASKDGKILVNTDTNSLHIDNMPQFLEEQGCENAEEIWDYMFTENRGIFLGTVNDHKGWFCYSTVPRTKWMVVTFLPMHDIYDGDFLLKCAFLLIGLIALMSISIAFTRILIRRNLEPLNGLTEAAREVTNRNYQSPLPEVGNTKELSTLVSTFDQMRNDIHKHIEQEKISNRIENELRIAQSIQYKMLPPVDVEHPCPQLHDFYAFMRTAREVGGDLYHYHYVDHRLLFSIGDVSGKGVPSAIYMSQIITQLRYISITSEKEHSRNMDLINRSVCEENKLNMFATLMLVELNLDTGELITCNAGQDPPIIIAPDGTVSQLILNTNIPIGLEKDFKFVKQTDIIAPGSVIFCYTDGVTEAMNEQGDLYGLDRLCEVLRGMNKFTPKEIIGLVQKDIDAFVGQAERSDDITMFVVNYRG